MDTRITPFQLYSMFLVFLLGTAIIFGTPRLVPDTWMVDLMTIVPSLLLAGLFYALSTASGERDLFQMLELAWGRYIGRGFVFGYSVYFLYIASRDMRDMLELILTSLLRNTPGSFLIIVFALLVAYAAAGGIAAMGRLSVLIAGMVLLFFLTLTIFLFFSGSVDPERLLPMFSQGFGPIAGAPFRSSIWFPYGELIVFLAFAPLLGTSRSLRRTGLWAVLSSAVLLTFSDALQTSTLGMENQKYSVFALLDAARLINIANFITRMDALVAFIFIFGVLVKASVFLYAGAKGASTLFRRPTSSFALPLALLAGALSLLVTRNYAEHVEEGLVYVIYWLHIPFQFGVPLASLLMLRMRGQYGSRAGDNHGIQ